MSPHPPSTGTWPEFWADSSPAGVVPHPSPNFAPSPPHSFQKKILAPTINP
jgi:hypothetical protein